jgi:hypothetical protein
MYHPAPRVETIVYIKKENGSIVYNGPHDSVSQKQLEKYLRDEREQSSHNDSRKGSVGRKVFPALALHSSMTGRC